jgi:hypothetical protein
VCWGRSIGSLAVLLGTQGARGRQTGVEKGTMAGLAMAGGQI